jgi:hypothetical protein
VKGLQCYEKRVSIGGRKTRSLKRDTYVGQRSDGLGAMSLFSATKTSLRRHGGWRSHALDERARVLRKGGAAMAGGGRKDSLKLSHPGEQFGWHGFPGFGIKYWR